MEAGTVDQVWLGRYYATFWYLPQPCFSYSIVLLPRAFRISSWHIFFALGGGGGKRANLLRLPSNMPDGHLLSFATVLSNWCRSASGIRLWGAGRGLIVHELARSPLPSALFTFQGFRKALKKHDKNTGLITMDEYLEQKVGISRFISSVFLGGVHVSTFRSIRVSFQQSLYCLLNRGWERVLCYAN